MSFGERTCVCDCSMQHKKYQYRFPFSFQYHRFRNFTGDLVINHQPSTHILGFGSMWERLDGVHDCNYNRLTQPPSTIALITLLQSATI